MTKITSASPCFCIWGHCITCCTTVSKQIVCTLGDVIIHGPIVIVIG